MPNSTMDSDTAKERYILHIMLCGFHHKKGCILEFVYPPLYDPGENKNPLELPAEWSNIPSLALPEGAHNYQSDSVYFHVESRTKPNRTVFGVSTYRQVDSNAVKNKSIEVTRSSVQKSVCVLCTLPLYGLLKTKLNSITYSFFAGGDFSKTELLEATYTQLDAASRRMATGGWDDLFVDVDLLGTYCAYRTDLLVAVKLLLLQRRVLFTASPASRLANTLLSLLSLLPSSVRHGLLDAVPSSSDRLAAEAEYESHSVSEPTSRRKSSLPAEQHLLPPPQASPVSLHRTLSRSADTLSRRQDVLQSTALSEELLDCTQPPEVHRELKKSGLLQLHGKPQRSVVLTNVTKSSTLNSNRSSPVQSTADSIDSLRATDYLDTVCSDVCKRRNEQREVDELGFPLVLFDMRLADSFCLPYACLQDLNWLMSTRSRCFLVGCNNPLFTMPAAIKIYDAIVDESKVKVQKHELNKLLKITSADLRFLDRLESATSMRRSHDDKLFDSTNWEGSDDWIREQFRLYLVRLLRVAQNTETSAMQDYGTHFVKAFRKTSGFKLWDKLALDGRLGSELSHYPPLHPCSSLSNDSSGTSNDGKASSRSPQNEHRKKQTTLSAVNEGLVRGKQLVSSKLASFLGFGKDNKARKADRHEHDSEFTAVASDNTAHNTQWYDKPSIASDNPPTLLNCDVASGNTLTKLVVQQDSPASVKRWASSASSGARKSPTPATAANASSTLSRL